MAVLVFAIGCKYPDPGFDIPADDQPPGDADPDGDGTTDPDMDLGPRCPEFTSADSNVELPGIQVAGFAAVEDESFALSFLSANKIGYTLPPLGQDYAMTNLANNVIGVQVLADGSALYLIDYNLASNRVQRAINAGGPATWNASTASGLPDAFPGRPTDDDQKVAFADEDGSRAYEWERVAGTWTMMRTYLPDDFGLDMTSKIYSANLSPDGAFLLYTVTGTVDTSGIYWRVRGATGFSATDGGYGGRLVDGTYDQPHLTMRCTHMFARNTTTSMVERWDIHP